MSGFTHIPDAWDLVLAENASDTDPLTLRLISDGSTSQWEGTDAPAISGDQYVYHERAIMWKPLAGCGFSRRTPETTTSGPDGQIVSVGTGYGRNATFVLPGVAMPAGKLTEVTPLGGAETVVSVIQDAAEFGTNHDLFLTTRGRYLIKIAGGNGIVSAIDFGAGYQTRSLQVFDNKLYLSGGITGPIQEFDGTTWTAAAVACKALDLGRVNWTPSNAIMGGSGGGTPADHLLLVDTTGAGFFHVVTGNDPKVFANWISVAGASIPVGEPSYPISKIVASGRVAWFAKPNGLYGFTETGRAVNLTPWMESAYDVNNGQVAEFYSDGGYQALVFYGHQQGLVGVVVNGNSQDTAKFIQFGSHQPFESPIWGRPRAIAIAADCIFVAYWDGLTSTVMRLTLQGGGLYDRPASGQATWSGSERTLVDEEITWMRFSSPGSKPRLWLATVDRAGLPHLYWQSQPESGNPWIDYANSLSHRFETDWGVTLPIDDGGSSALKVLRRYDLVARNIGDGNVVAVDAAKDGGAYVAQATVSEGARSSFTADTYYDGTWFGWQLRCLNSETVPVVLETLQVRMSVMPEQSDLWTFRCQLADGQGLGNDALDIQDPNFVRQRVRALQRRGQVLMPRSPLSRETLVVKVEQGSKIEAVRDRKTNETIVVLTLMVSVLQEGATYNADRYGEGQFGVAVGS